MNFTDTYNSGQNITVSKQTDMFDYMDYIEQKDVEDEIENDLLQVESAFNELSDVQKRHNELGELVVGIEDSSREGYNVILAGVSASLDAIDIPLPTGVSYTDNTDEHISDAKKLATEGIGDVIKKVFNAIVNFFGKIWDFISNLLKKVWAFITGLFTDKEEKILKECKDITSEQAEKIAVHINNKTLYLTWINGDKSVVADNNLDVLDRDNYIKALRTSIDRQQKEVDIYGDIMTDGPKITYMGVVIGKLVNKTAGVSVSSKAFIDYNAITMEPFTIAATAFAKNADKTLQTAIAVQYAQYDAECKKYFQDVGIEGKYTIHILLKTIKQKPRVKDAEFVHVDVTIGAIVTFIPTKDFKIGSLKAVMNYVKNLGSLMRILPTKTLPTLMLAIDKNAIELTAADINKLGVTAAGVSADFKAMTKELNKIGAKLKRDIKKITKIAPKAQSYAAFGQQGINSTAQVMMKYLTQLGIKDYIALGTKITKDYLTLAQSAAKAIT